MNWGAVETPFSSCFVVLLNGRKRQKFEFDVESTRMYGERLKLRLSVSVLPSYLSEPVPPPRLVPYPARAMGMTCPCLGASHSLTMDIFL